MSLIPSSEEIEISIFGKGFGECIVVHLGDGQWMIIDSFKDPHTKKPVALEYLRSIGVDNEKAVKAVVATHWHDDHICGLGEIVAECKNAMFICSEATRMDEFLQLIYSDVDLKEKRPGIEELGKILEELKSRKASVIRAVENKILINDSKYQIYSLSPCDDAITLAQKQVVKLLPKVMQPRRGVADIAPNHTGVVLLICAGVQKILLGADLEESGNNQLGWSRIVASPGRPSYKSNAFKIPHHGSITAHCDDVWVKLLERNPPSFLTAFVRGLQALPKKTDVSRILKFSDKVWITTNPYIKRKPYKRDNTVERTIKESTKSMRSISDKGQIRMRVDRRASDNAWEVKLFGTALPLAECLRA
jgi:beta-lactamase superfamily II metal-dependent hydrolase